MIDIRDRSLCTGCTACVSSCPVQCIVMRRDREEGFDYPVANPDLCIGCGKCESVCPVIHPLKATSPLKTYASRSPRHLQRSSSGGLFPVLAEDVIMDGGVVYGAMMYRELTVGHERTDNMDGIASMSGSKYVQSDLYSVLTETKEDLESGRKVLFSGTPCQVAGLKSYLGKDYEGLLAVDCACHGVPSPGLWEMYVRALDKKVGTSVNSVRFRDKRHGWRRYDVVYGCESGEVVVSHQKDPYMNLFLQDISLRPSCYQCPFRQGKSGSDLTLADLWNAAAAVPEMNDDRGVSLVCVNTDKGRAAFEAVKDSLEVKAVEYNEAIKNNGGFAGHVDVPERRAEFFVGIHSAKDVYAYMSGFVVREPMLRSLYKSARRFAVKLKGKIVK